MFCTYCGKPGAGNFCGYCGTALASGNALAADVAHIPVPEDWSNENRYDVLIRVPEVRERIAAHASRAKATMSAEEFLQVGDKVLSPLMGGVPIGKLAAIAQPIYAKLGVRTGKRREQSFAKPVGNVLAAALCALAGSGQKIRGVTQLQDGCHLEAVLPSDLFSFAGDVLIDITRQGAGTRLVAATNVPGQLFDWGKSDRCLNSLLNEIGSLLGVGSGTAARAA